MSRLVRDVMTDAPVASPDTSGEFVYDLFSDDKDLLVVAVVQDGQPVGMVHVVHKENHLHTCRNK